MRPDCVIALYNRQKNYFIKALDLQLMNLCSLKLFLKKESSSSFVATVLAARYLLQPSLWTSLSGPSSFGDVVEHMAW